MHPAAVNIGNAATLRWQRIRGFLFNLCEWERAAKNYATGGGNASIDSRSKRVVAPVPPVLATNVADRESHADWAAAMAIAGRC
jgi:hypothetical protein